MPDPSAPPDDPPFGANVIGWFGSDSGLGATARLFAQALEDRAVPVSRVDISAEATATETPDAQAARIRSALTHPVNLYVVGAGLEGVLMRRDLMLRPGRMHVGMLWWETTVLPPDMATPWRAMDAVIACSPFIASIAANHLPFTPVIAAKHPAPDVSTVRPDRARFGLPDGALVFVASFDALSDMARKNPVAIITAFRAAFSGGGEGPDARLIVRINHADHQPFTRWSVQQLAAAAGNDRRIQLLTAPMDYGAVMTLYVSADAYVSLHRAEGLGLGLMEAMALGKPVIATGWSGNMDFMSHDCACLVRYALGQAHGLVPAFDPARLGPNALWAAPVLDDAVAWMRRLADGNTRARIGEAARRRMVRHQADAAAIGWASDLAALWRQRTLLPPPPGKYSKPSPA